jgi:hypothetical protein
MPKRDPKRADGVAVEKRRGEGPRFFPADRTPDIFFRSLFGFGTVEFGIAVMSYCGIADTLYSLYY